MGKSGQLIIFADRNLEWSATLRRRLRERGSRVVSTRSPRKLMAVLRVERPDLVVLGDSLEGVGAELLGTLIHKWCPGTRVVSALSSRQALPAGKGTAEDALYRTSSRAVREELEAVIEDALRQVPKDATAARPPLIVCVDDDRLFLESLARLIRRQGYRVMIYTEPRLALDELSQVRPDLLIVDVLMPEMNGFEFLDEVRRRPDGPPVVLLSAVGSPEHIAAGRERGAACYLTKPCPTETLFEAVRGLLHAGVTIPPTHRSRARREPGR